MEEHSSLKALMIGGVIVIGLWAILSVYTRSMNSQQSLVGNNVELQNLQNLEQQQILEGDLPMASMKTLEDYTPIEGNTVSLQTSKGVITIELYREQAPITTLNFLSLVRDGFYDGILFHRVIEGFMAQAGDPLTTDASQQARWGTGNPGYVIPDEFDPSLTHSEAGILSMANSGPNTGGSQFFITFEATPWLDGKHAVFGKVTSGLDILMQIEQGDAIERATITQ